MSNQIKWYTHIQQDKSNAVNESRWRGGGKPYKV